MVPLEAAKSLLMAAKLELFITSTIVKLLNGRGPFAVEDEDDEENELETLVVGLEGESGEFVESCCRDAAELVLDEEEDVGIIASFFFVSFVEIVSSKELNLVKFIIQPSILRNSLSSLTFCQDTFRVLEEIASTITSSG